MRYIREHACDGITVADVLRVVPLSRRMLEYRFQKLVGRSPHAEIVRTRIETHQPAVARDQAIAGANCRPARVLRKPTTCAWRSKSMSASRRSLIAKRPDSSPNGITIFYNLDRPKCGNSSSRISKFYRFGKFACIDRLDPIAFMWSSQAFSEKSARP